MYHTMRVVSFCSDELQFDYATKQVKLIKIVIRSKLCCEILYFFDSACVSFPFQNTKYDWVRLKNRIKNRLTISRKSSEPRYIATPTEAIDLRTRSILAVEEEDKGKKEGKRLTFGVVTPDTELEDGRASRIN